MGDGYTAGLFEEKDNHHAITGDMGSMIGLVEIYGKNQIFLYDIWIQYLGHPYPEMITPYRLNADPRRIDNILISSLKPDNEIKETETAWNL